MTSTPTHPAAPAVPLLAPTAGSRRAEIAEVAAEEFTRRGYHSTKVEHIAVRLSVTPGALYRHVPGKYEMFRDAVATLVTALESASLADPSSLEDMVQAITRTTLQHRSRAALYRWQGRYLTPEDRAAVVEVDARVRRRLANAVRRRRQHRQFDQPPETSATAVGSPSASSPGAGSAGASSAAAAILSCIASLGHHRIDLTDDDAVALMTSIADDLALSAPSSPSIPPSLSAASSASLAPAGSPTPTPRLRGGAATREGAISAAIARFHSSGYDSVTMEAIGADVGVAASALYRHFPGKSALLTAAVDRTATLVEELLDSHAALYRSDTEPADLLEAMLGQYVAIAFSHGPDLMLYHSELGSLDPEDRRRLRRAQRRQLDRWAGLVQDAGAGAGAGVAAPAPAPAPAPAASQEPAPARPDDAIARIRVHAALAVVLDGGQGTGFHPAASARFGQLAALVLLPQY